MSGAGASSFLLGAHGGGSPCHPPTRPGRGAGAKPGRGLGPSTLFSRRRPDDLGKPSSTLHPQELGVLRTRLIGVTRKVYKCLLSVPHAGHSHNSVCQLEFNIIFKALRSTRADSRQRGCSRWCGRAGTRLGFGVRGRTPAPRPGRRPRLHRADACCSLWPSARERRIQSSSGVQATGARPRPSEAGPLRGVC